MYCAGKLPGVQTNREVTIFGFCGKFALTDFSARDICIVES